VHPGEAPGILVQPGAILGRSSLGYLVHCKRMNGDTDGIDNPARRNMQNPNLGRMHLHVNVILIRMHTQACILSVYMSRAACP
jgi:hypothetical protein